MKTLLHLSLAVLFCILASPCFAGEDVMLVVAGHPAGGAPAETRYSEPIILAAGDKAVFVYRLDGEAQADVEATISGYTFYVDARTFPPLPVPPVIIGPATIRLKRIDTKASPSMAVFSVNRANAPANVVPSNAVVIPEDANGQFNVILESSTDLITWTPAMPGSYCGSTQKRFFRTRVVRTN